MGVPRYKKQKAPSRGARADGQGMLAGTPAQPYTAAGGMKPRTDAQKALDALRGFYENYVKPTGPGFDEKIAEMGAVKMPPFMAPSSSPYANKLTTPWMNAAGKKVELGLGAIASSNWGQWFGGEEILNIAKNEAKPMDFAYLGLNYAPFGLGKIAKARKAIIPSIKILKAILDTNK